MGTQGAGVRGRAGFGLAPGEGTGAEGLRGGPGRLCGPGKAQPGRAAGAGRFQRRGGDGRGSSFPLPSLHFLKQDVGRPGDVMGSPSPAPRPGRMGVGIGEGGTPRGFPQQRVEGRGKSL